MQLSGVGDVTVGRGRGVLGIDSPDHPGASSVNVKFSTPFREEMPPLDFGVVDSPVVLTKAQVKQMSNEISNSIKQELFSNTAPGHSSPALEHHQCNSATQCGVTAIDASKLNLVLKSQVKEPPYFRGDKTDKCSIFDWVELMRVYLGKKDLQGHKLIGEVVDKLMGRAKDITKVWLRNNSGVSERGDVEAVYRILTQHFGDTVCSAIPLSDFYATLPHRNEGPLDYWVRLNKAAEVVEQCLKCEGRTMPNQSMEIAVMFIRNCPSKELSLVFMSKPQREWTASEVQERLDEFLRERTESRGQLSQHMAATVEPVVACSTAHGNYTSNSPASGCESERTTTEGHALDKILGMLEKALVCSTQSAQGNYEKHDVKRNVCRVCQSYDHSTIAHCRRHKLCFKCYQAGHTRPQCQMNMQPQVSPVARTPQTEPQGN